MTVPFNFQELKKRPLKAGSIKVYLVWFDSYGAKSSCIFIETPDIRLLVDPGASAMQPSYPLSATEKEKLCQTALNTIIDFSRHADTIFISHYHYDHHTLPSREKTIYRGKNLWIKDPNRWINRSQWGRARLFLNQLYETYGSTDYTAMYTEPENNLKFNDPVEWLPLAMAKDYGDYQNRKNQLLEKGRAWFNKTASLWHNENWISEIKLKDIDVQIADGSSFKKGSTSVKFTWPMFHGIEYNRVGWVVGLSVEHKGRKVVYTSDLQGPNIEDYAQWIIKENPDILVLDGPATYLFGFIVNRINLQRSIDNLCDILKNTKTGLIVYDHHLLRDARFKERTAQAYLAARVGKKAGKKTLLTASEWIGYEPLILKITKDENE